MVITFDPDGTVRAVHNDNMPLTFLGDMKVERASDIQWTNYTKWSIHYREAGGVFADPTHYGLEQFMYFESYDDARRFEVEHMEHCMLYGAHPLSSEGVKLGEHLRRRFLRGSGRTPAA